MKNIPSIIDMFQVMFIQLFSPTVSNNTDRFCGFGRSENSTSSSSVDRRVYSAVELLDQPNTLHNIINGISKVIIYKYLIDSFF